MSDKLRSWLKFILVFLPAFIILCVCGFFTPSFGYGEKSVVVVGMDRDYPPHEFVENGEIKGFNVDVLESCARSIGMTLEWRPMKIKDVYIALGNGEIDAACMAGAHQYQHLFKFTSEPIYDPTFAVFVRRETGGINSIEDLHFRTVAVEEGHTTHDELKEYHPEIISILVSNQRDALRLVLNGDVLAAYVEYNTGNYFIRKFGWYDLKVAKELNPVSPRVIAFARNREDLRDKFNAALIELKKSGEYDALLKKWFQKPGVSPLFWRKALLIGLIVLVVLIIGILGIFLWNRSLRKKIRQKTEELFERERFLHGVFEGIQDGISVLDSDLNVIRVNEAMKKWYSFRAPLEGRKCYEVYHSRSEVCTWCPSVRTLKTGNPDYEMVPYVNAEGREGFMDVFTSPFRSETGGITGVIEYVRDATERESARKKIEQGKREWENIFESISDPVIIVELDHTIIDANRAALALLGDVSKEKIVGKYCHSIFHNSDKPPDGCPLDALKISQHPETIEMEMEAMGGWFLVTVAPVFDEEGRFTKAIHIAKDITERKKGEIALRESEARFHGIVDNAGFGVVMHRRGELIFANKMAHKILGFEYGEKLEKPMIDYIVEEDKQEILDATKKRYKGVPTPARHQIAVIRKDGKKAHIDMGVSIIPYKGEMVEIVSFIDITEQRQLEEQLLQAQKMEAVGRLAGGIAHDFNNILTAIGGYTDLLMMQSDKGTQPSRWITEIHHATDRAAILTSQLLTFSRRQILTPMLLDINETVKNMENLLRRILGEDLELNVYTIPNLWLVKADKTRIEQVIMNLAVNARDAMVKGGKLTIETANVVLNEEYCNNRLEAQPGSYVMIAVTDTGAGMNEETKRHIFDPFFTTKEPGKGTGLGLSTVYGIIKQSGGFIWVYSELGRGTTFKIYLPRISGEAENIFEREHVTADMTGGSEMILLVEDDEQVCDLTARILQTLGYKVVSASDGEKALEIEKEYAEDINLLITDVVMPRMGGVELAEKFLQRRPNAKVLYITGYAEKGIINNGFLSSGVSILQKPYTAFSLAGKVREVLGDNS